MVTARMIQIEYLVKNYIKISGIQYVLNKEQERPQKKNKNIEFFYFVRTKSNREFNAIEVKIFIFHYMEMER